MQEQHLFEYAVIRVVPRVEREEFLNIGIILFCTSRNFLELKYELDTERFRIFTEGMDTGIFEDNLHAFQRICKGGTAAGPIGLLPARERFRWITATRSSILQTSKAHSGFCTDAAAALDRLMQQLVY
ncbi:DUF3037 domain-containing protein [Taibaiella chishuiensis]|uniref:DUF3037 family protein n=1 Tax=Taibaiella chishuiensis TaxID=1434707 RepID=A0A2P8D5P1_9BACT|nr:DUF3037 domain-containing protein [Taibaiella chishuiensis]PSK92543.1 Protein of unknown function (DUF3037) [Taibaiella chishuiensis]